MCLDKEVQSEGIVPTWGMNGDRTCSWKNVCMARALQQLPGEVKALDTDPCTGPSFSWCPLLSSLKKLQLRHQTCPWHLSTAREWLGGASSEITSQNWNSQEVHIPKLKFPWGRNSAPDAWRLGDSVVTHWRYGGVEEVLQGLLWAREEFGKRIHVHPWENFLPRHWDRNQERKKEK